MICFQQILLFTHPYPVVEGVAASEEDQLLEQAAAAPLPPSSCLEGAPSEVVPTPQTSGINKNIKDLRVNTADLNSEPLP